MLPTVKRIPTYLTLIFAIACASPGIQKQEISADSNLNEVVSQTQTLEQTALEQRANIFAKAEFDDGAKYLKKAKEEVVLMSEKNIDREEVANNLGYAQAFFIKATELAAQRRKDFREINKAREAAVYRGDIRNSIFNQRLQEIDHDLMSDTDGFTSILSPEEKSHFQNRYLELEVYAVQRKEVGPARDEMERLEALNAPKFIPNTFFRAKSDLLASENLIARSPRNPINFKSSVNRAKQSIIFLREVYDVIENNGFQTPEPAAVKIVNQNRALGKAGTNITSLSTQLMNQDNRIKAQETIVRLQQKLNKDEAEIFLQGNQVIVRLKELNFAIGSAKLPQRSKDTLTTVKNVIDELGAKKLIVQGHTDATGSSRVNRIISQKRATEVADFLKIRGTNSTLTTRGHGEDLPIASNQTANGRKLNRRVDLVIPYTSDTILSE